MNTSVSLNSTLLPNLYCQQFATFHSKDLWLRSMAEWYGHSDGVAFQMEQTVCVLLTEGGTGIQ